MAGIQLIYSNDKVRTLEPIQYLFLLPMLALSSCITGAPTLNDEQEHKLSSLTVYPLGQAPSKPYSEIGTVSAANCTGAPMHGRVYGNVDLALDALKRKAVVLNADSIIDVSCGAVPLLNNCWSAEKCWGKAIAFSNAQSLPN